METEQSETTMTTMTTTTTIAAITNINNNDTPKMINSGTAKSNKNYFKSRQRTNDNGVPLYTLKELSTHNANDNVWMAIHNKVYDVTPFLCKHPGGAEVLLDCAGVDATVHFDDVGHSEDSRMMLMPLYKGELVPEDRVPGNDEDTSFNIPPEKKICREPHSKARAKNVDYESFKGLLKKALTAIVSDNGVREEEIRRAMRDNNSQHNHNRLRHRSVQRTTAKTNTKGTNNSTLSTFTTPVVDKSLSAARIAISASRRTKKKRAKRSKRAVWQELTYAVLAIIAVASAVCFLYLQQRKWQ